MICCDFDFDLLFYSNNKIVTRIEFDFKLSAPPGQPVINIYNLHTGTHTLNIRLAKNKKITIFD